LKLISEIHHKHNPEETAMKSWKFATLTLAIAATFPAAVFAQSNAEVLTELRALRAKVAELEEKLGAAQAARPAGAASGAQWGMTPEQVADFNRVATKAEATEDAREASGLRGLKFSGYVDPTYVYNKRQKRAGFQFLNKVESDGYNYDNSYFGSASLDLQKEMDGGTKWRLTLMPNRGAGSSFDTNSIVHEASVSVPLGDLQTRLIAGQIPDWSGYEYLPSTQNKLITHNLLFDFTLPVAYTGAGLELSSGKWISKVILANLNASKRQAGEKTPVVAYRVDYSRGEYQGFGFAGVHGKATNLRAADAGGNLVKFIPADPVAGTPEVIFPFSTKDTAVNLFEVDGYFIRGDWTVQGQFSVGGQKSASVTADPLTGELRDAKWWGASALVAYKFDPRLEGIVRADYINNKKNGGGLLGYSSADGRNGIGPDTAGDTEIGANRTALTFGVSYSLNSNTTLKAEYRLDRASQPVFLNFGDNTYSKSNQLFGTSVLVSF
jgi:hypothetical protein